MKFHWHTSIDNGLIYGLYALAFFNLWQLIAFWLAARQWGPAHKLGTAMGALVSFGVPAQRTAA